MCMHEKPVRNDEPGGYGIEGRAPSLKDGDKLLFDECGRCSPQINGKGSTDYHTYHFRLVKREFGPLCLLVRHGGGEERHEVGYSFTRLKELIEFLPNSDARYLMFQSLYSNIRDAASVAQQKEHSLWVKAAAEKRIKTRRLPSQGRIKVWIKA